MVASAWHAIAETHLMEGRKDPWKLLGTHSQYFSKRLSRMLRHYGFQDPPP